MSDDAPPPNAPAQGPRHLAEDDVGIVRPRDYTHAEPFVFKSGQTIQGFTLRYETYGTLNATRDNAVLVCHALSGDHHCAGWHSPSDPKPGWWNNLIGPGKAVDTRRFFVVCANVLGGCQGSTGPSSVDPSTGRPYGTRFPFVTIRDMVHAQKLLLDHLGIAELHAVLGGSMGGMTAMIFAIEYPQFTRRQIIMASTANESAQAIAFNEVGRQAIMQDPAWNNGDYPRDGGPRVGLAIARMMAHITYLSEEGMREKFGRRLQNGSTPRFGFDVDFQVESYLHHQGEVFLRRFDANSYLYLTRAMDYFDPFGDMAQAGPKLAALTTPFLVVSFDSDWRFDTAHSREIVQVLAAHRVPVSFREIASTHGHDSFLLVIPEYHRTVANFLQRIDAGPSFADAGGI